MKKKSLIFGLVFGMVFQLLAQPEFKWPENKAKAEESYVLVSDNVKAERWKESIKPLSWLLKNAPDLNSSLYINGAKIYEGILENNLFPDKENAYEDSAMLMYDMRIKYFGEEANVLNRKGLKAYKYWIDRPEKLNELTELYQKIFELNGTEVYSSAAIYYMDLVSRKHKNKDYDDAKVMEIYETINNVIETNITNGVKVSSWESMKDQVDKKLAQTVEVDCDFVRNNFGPKYKESNDVKIAKKIVAYMNSGGCTNDPLFLDALKTVTIAEPSFGGYITLARKAKKAGNLEDATNYFNTCLNDFDEPEKDAEIYFELADIYNRKGDNVTTRSYAFKSIEAGSEFRAAAYTLIGDLYFLSGNSCKGENVVENRAVYIAAYNMYQKAGNSSKMDKAKQQFPSMEEIFTYGKKIGDQINVGCWINESVILDKRP